MVNPSKIKLIINLIRAGELLLGVTKDSNLESGFFLKSVLNQNTDYNYKFDKVYIENFN